MSRVAISIGKHRLIHDGHGKVFSAIADHAKKVEASAYKIFTTAKQSESARVPSDHRLELLKRAFPKHAENFGVAAHLGDAIDQTVREHNPKIVDVVVGGDRFDEFAKGGKADKLRDYYGLDAVNIINGGERDENAEGVEGFSSSKMQQHLEAGDHGSARRMLPSNLSVKDKNLFMKTYKQYYPGKENTEEKEVTNEWFVSSEFNKFMENENLIQEAAKYLRPDLYLVRKRKTNKIEVVVRPDPDEDVVTKGGPESQKPSITDVKNAIAKGEFKQTPTSIKIFGDLSDEMKGAKKEKKAGKAKAEKDTATGQEDVDPNNPFDFSEKEAENKAQALNMQQQAFVPTESPIGMDSVEYPGPTKPIPNGDGTQFEFAVLYTSLRSAGFSEQALQQRNDMSNGRLFAFSKKVFEMAKRTSKLIPEECRQGLRHSTEAGIRGNPEPKTDLVCGENRISLKLDGDVQLSSEQSSTASKTINSIAANAFSQDVDFNTNILQKMIKSMEKLPPKMIASNNLERAVKQHSGKPWFDSMFKDGRLNDEVNWDKIKDGVVAPMVEDFQKYLDDNEDFKRRMIHEAMTGQLMFGEENPEAVASHILSPNGFSQIGDPESPFIDDLMDKVKIGIRAKSRSDRITNAALRIELKGSKVKITEAEEVQTTQDEEGVITPEKLTEFYKNNMDILIGQVIDKLNFSLSGNISDVIEDKLTNIITIGKKEIKIPVTGQVPEPEALTDIDESFINFMEQDDPSKRDYKHEYKTFHGKPEQRKKRSNRVLARRKMIKKGKASKGDGKDIDHKDGNALNNGDFNLRVQSKKKNRSRNKHKKGEKAGKKHKKVNEHAGFEGTDELLKTYIKQTPHMKFDFKSRGKKQRDYRETN